MKKIFAIALAAVMVLSMASAFALSDCYANFAWPCDAEVMYCGRGSVEVVPVVKVNSACGGYEYQINECAGAVADDEVYFAIRLNVEANPDYIDNHKEGHTAGWWDVATLTIDFDGKALTDADVEDYKFADATGIDWDADKAKSYYLYNDDATATDDWVDVTTKGLDFADVVFESTVAETAKASDAEVCAVLESVHDGVGNWFYGDYVVNTETENQLVVSDGTNTYTYTYDPVNGVDKVEATADFAKEVEKVFNLAGCSLGTCFTAKNIQKNFGWDNTVESETEIKDCFNWSAKAAAIVDAECVVAIPKTGDASLLAWLF